jgi:hypothetical protein
MKKINKTFSYKATCKDDVSTAFEAATVLHFKEEKIKLPKGFFDWDSANGEYSSEVVQMLFLGYLIGQKDAFAALSPWVDRAKKFTEYITNEAQSQKS